MSAHLRHDFCRHELIEIPLHAPFSRLNWFLFIECISDSKHLSPGSESALETRQSVRHLTNIAALSDQSNSSLLFSGFFGFKIFLLRRYSMAILECLEGKFILRPWRRGTSPFGGIRATSIQNRAMLLPVNAQRPVRKELLEGIWVQHDKEMSYRRRSSCT